MVYDPKTWADGELITAEDLNRLEQAIDATDAALDGKAESEDERFSDARTPTEHQHPVADVTGLADRLAALEYDSGWREITTLHPADSFGTMRRSCIRRRATTVYLEGYGEPGPYLTARNKSETIPFLTLPAGFTAASYVPGRGTVTLGYGAFSGVLCTFSDRNAVDIVFPQAAGKIEGFMNWSVEFETTDSMPTTLPGDPA